MSGVWRAPATAYLLAAMVADSDPAAEKTWKDLDKLRQCDVLEALGAQLRQEVIAYGTSCGAGAVITQIDIPETLRTELCGEAARALAHLLAQKEPWELPECGHCREEMAKAVIHTIIRISYRRGISGPDYARMCRESASGAASG